MVLVLAVLIGLLPIATAVLYFVQQRKTQPSEAARTLVHGLNGLNALVGLMAAGVGFVRLFAPGTAAAAGLNQAAATDPYATLAAAISTGLACVGAGIAVAGSGAAAVGAIAEKPESFGRSLIFVGLSEGIAIYGLLISFLVLNR